MFKVGDKVICLESHVSPWEGYKKKSIKERSVNKMEVYTVCFIRDHKYSLGLTEPDHWYDPKYFLPIDVYFKNKVDKLINE